MMRLRDLFDNRDLAVMIVKSWDHDEQSLELFKYFRISANAVYPFTHNGAGRILRFCPESEKTREGILAELDFIRYLRGRGYNAHQAIPSKTGEELRVVSTPWGRYHACVFARVPGAVMEKTALDEGVMRVFGQSLGVLHALSRDYTSPVNRRWAHGGVLDWIGQTLNGLPAAGEPAFIELDILRKVFSRLPVDRANYGLVHYDFELDNVFYDPATRSCHVIDFDDAMYHWYAMDVVQTLDSLEMEVPAADFPGFKTAFLDGYRSRVEADDETMGRLPLFRRFASLYGYTRILRSVHESWDNEPAWMAALRTKLDHLLGARAAFFGAPV